MIATNDRAAQSRQICILGNDPGVSGAIAFYFPSAPKLIAEEDAPTVDNQFDAATLAARIRQMAPVFAVIYQVASTSKQGAALTFEFGIPNALARDVVVSLGTPNHLVTPTRLKKHCRLTADKEEATALALRLWLETAHLGRKKDHS